MYKKIIKLLPILIIICGLFIIIAPLTFAGPCKGLLELKNGMAVPMKCVWSARVIIIFGILFCFNGVFLLFVNNSAIFRFCGIQTVVMAIAFLLIPTSSVIGICGKDMSACNYMANIERIAGIILLIIGFLLALNPSSTESIENK